MIKIPKLSEDLRWPALIILLAILIYGYSLTNNFSWDDNNYILKNPGVLSWTGLPKLWSSLDLAFYDNPLTLTFFWVQHKLWGVHPMGYHIISLVLHILNALLFFGLAKKTAPAIAGIPALLFTIHPIQVETVAWIAEQKNLFCLFFLQLAFHSYLNFDENGERKNYFKMLLFFFMSILSKSIGICFIAIPFLHAWWKKGTLGKHQLLLVIPLLCLGSLTATWAVHVHHLYEVRDGIASFPERMILSGKLFFFYIKQMLLPWRFLTFYPKWNLDSTRWTNWMGLISLLILYGAFYWQRRRLGRGAFTLLCFYGISIFPALGLFHVTFMKFSYAADHFTYLSLPPIILLAVSAAYLFQEKAKIFLTQKKLFSLSWFPKSIFALIVVYLALLSFRLTFNYANSVMLFSQLLIQFPESAAAHFHMGRLCLDNPNACELDQAGYFFQKAIQLGQKDFDTYEGLGSVCEKKLYFRKALAAYQLALNTENRPILLAYVYQRMGVICLFLNNPRLALVYFEKAIAHTQGPLYRKQLRLYSAKGILNSADEFVDLGNAYFFNGKYPEAAKAFRSAVILAPQDAENHLALGKVLVELGNTKEALKSFETAHKLVPENKNISAAIQALRKNEPQSVTSDPSNPNLQRN